MEVVILRENFKITLMVTTTLTAAVIVTTIADATIVMNISYERVAYYL